MISRRYLTAAVALSIGTLPADPGRAATADPAASAAPLDGFDVDLAQTRRRWWTSRRPTRLAARRRSSPRAAGRIDRSRSVVAFGNEIIAEGK